MINLNSIIQSAQNGEGVQNLARQFDISPQQAQEAVQALLPAISMGLQQQTQGAGFAQLLGHLAAAPNRAAFDDAAAAQSDETVASGTDVLNHLFGNEDVTQKVADNAARHSSLGSDLLGAMLPVIAAMAMGGLCKSIAAKGGLGGIFGQAPAAPAPAPRAQDGGIGDIAGQMTGRPAPQTPDEEIGDILGQMTGQKAAPGQGHAAPAPQAQGGGGLGDLLGGLLGGGLPGHAPQQGGGLGDILGQLAGARRGGAQAPQQGGGGLGDLLGGLLGGGAGGAQGGGLGNILGQLAGAQRGGTTPGGGGLGDLLGGLLGGGAGGARGQAGGGISPAQIQAGLETLGAIFGHGTQVSPGQKSGLESILGQLLGGGR